MTLILISIPAFAILGSYLALIGIFGKGWKKIPYFLAEELTSSAKTVSVVVACRNEENNLPQLLRALHWQSISDFELILVNDHSTDRTAEIMQDATLHFENISIIQAQKQGKKAALREAILAAKGNLIITTDADCIPEKKWVETILAYQIKNDCDLIIAPVRMTENDTFFSKIESIEFSTLIASGAGAAGSGMPVMCNGANLAFRKQSWLAAWPDINENEISGDDIFLLLSIKKRGGKIRFLKSENAFASTKSAGNITAFFKQRQRWTAKSKSYNDLQIIVVAIVVLLASLMQVMLFAGSVFVSELWFATAIYFLIKYLIDVSFLLTANDLFKTKKLLFRSFILSVFYPFYISFTALSGLIKSPKAWK